MQVTFPKCLEAERITGSFRLKPLPNLLGHFSSIGGRDSFLWCLPPPGSTSLWVPVLFHIIRAPEGYLILWCLLSISLGVQRQLCPLSASPHCLQIDASVKWALFCSHPGERGRDYISGGNIECFPSQSDWASLSHPG